MDRIRLLNKIYNGDLTVEDALCEAYYDYIVDLVLRAGFVINTSDGTEVYRLDGYIEGIHYMIDVYDDILAIYEDGDLIIKARCDTYTDYTVEDWGKYESIVINVANKKLDKDIKEGLKELKVQMEEMNKDLKETNDMVKYINEKLRIK